MQQTTLLWSTLVLSAAVGAANGGGVRRGVKVAALVGFVLWMWNVHKVVVAYNGYWRDVARAVKASKERKQLKQQQQGQKVHRIVDDSVFEKSLEDLRSQLFNDNKGIDPRGVSIYGGPNSSTNKVAREAMLMLGGGRAAFLQLAHPFVAIGIEQHSDLMTAGSQKRFYRTFKYMFALQFGDMDEILAAARKLRKLHNKVNGTFKEDVGPYKKGDRYDAHVDEALYWVLCTLVDTLIFVHDLVIRPLTHEEKELLFFNSKKLGMCFGIPLDMFHESYDDFLAFMHDTWDSDSIVVGNSARILSQHLVKAPMLAGEPIMYLVRIITAALLPVKLRTQFELPFGPVQKVVFFLYFGLMRIVRRLTPDELWYFSQYIELEKRSGINKARPIHRLASFFGSIIIKTSLHGRRKSAIGENKSQGMPPPLARAHA